MLHVPTEGMWAYIIERNSKDRKRTVTSHEKKNIT